MIGSFLNALGILLGALFGLARRQPLTARTQRRVQSLLGALIVLCGLGLIGQNLTGGIGHALKQLFVAALALVAGALLGRLLALQKMSNRLGRFAAALLAAPGNQTPGKAGDGFLAATLLFCAAPLGLVGAVTDGLGGFFYPLALKAVMDGLAMMSFVKMFRWPAALAAFSVFLFFDGLAKAVHVFVLPHLAAPGLLAAVNLAAGLVICATAVVVLELRRVELANFLPALVLAPVLAKFLL